MELAPARGGYAARVYRRDWGGLPLNLGGIFATEAEARAWCERMAAVLAEDALDDEDSPSGTHRH